MHHISFCDSSPSIFVKVNCNCFNVKWKIFKTVHNNNSCSIYQTGRVLDYPFSCPSIAPTIRKIGRNLSGIRLPFTRIYSTGKKEI